MTVDELRQFMHRLHLDVEAEPSLIHLFYRTDDGRINNLSISVYRARQRNRQPMTDAQLAELLEGYPDARGAHLVAVEHPQRGLTQWLDTSDVCRRLHTTRQTLHRWAERGLVRPTRLGRRLYYDAGQIDRLLRSNLIQDNGRADLTGA